MRGGGAGKDGASVEEDGSISGGPGCMPIGRGRSVGGLGSEGDKTVLLGPKNWNPISSSKCTVLARHG